MKLKEIYKSKNPVISFEIFPPKGDSVDIKSKIDALFQELKILSGYNSSFISVTYGAGGSTREKTLELVLKIKEDLNILPLPHFTCVGSGKEEILEYLKQVQDNKIENILALRGDPPKGETEFKKPKDGFSYANELVTFIKSNSNLGIAVAGYPEGHQACEFIDIDIINLNRKVDSGADVVITQLFYDNKFFFNFMEKTQKARINIPIIPGVLPITNFAQAERMTSLCGCTLPDKLFEKLRKYQDDNEAIREIGIELAIQQCTELLEYGVPGLHFCILNKSYAAEKILNAININIAA